MAPAAVTRLRSSSSTLLIRAVPPFFAWWFARILVTYRAGQGLLSLGASSWVRWDSISYMGIARHGYYFHQCAPYEGLYNQHWCTNAAWFPGYPLLLRTARWLGLSLPSAGALLSACAFLAVLVVLWNGFLLELGLRRAVPLLAIAAAFPGVVYAFAVFPMSVEVLAIVVGLLAARHGRLLLMVAAVCVAVFTYPNAVILVPITVVYLVLLRSNSADQVRRRVLLGLATGLPIVAIAIWHATAGRWDAFLVAQHQQGTGFASPISVLWRLIVTRQGEIQVRSQSASLSWWVSAQTALTAVIVIAAVVVAVAAWRRRGRVDSTEALVVATVLATWLLGVSSTAGANPYRAVFALLPAVILLRHLKVSALWAIAGACALVTWGISAYFFVPTILLGGLV